MVGERKSGFIMRVDLDDLDRGGRIRVLVSGRSLGHA